jgi:hypothetical protein
MGVVHNRSVVHDRAMPTIPGSLAALIREQNSIVTRAQLRECEVSRGDLRAQLDGSRWRVLNDSVLCTHNGPLTAGQAAWAVVLSAQGPCALCGLSGMQDWGVRGFPTSTIHVLVMRGARVLPVPGVTVAVHESRRFSANDIFAGRRPGVTSLERSVIDAAVWARDGLTASRIVVAPVQQRMTTATRLLGELETAGRVQHRRAIELFLTDLDGGAEALSEVEFLRWCRRHGFPTPKLQVRKDSNGMRRYIDAVFSLPGGGRLLVEIDGGVHLTLASRWQDTLKDNDAMIAGERTLRFASVAIYNDDTNAIRQLGAALGLSAGRVA